MMAMKGQEWGRQALCHPGGGEEGQGIDLGGGLDSQFGEEEEFGDCEHQGGGEWSQGAHGAVVGAFEVGREVWTKGGDSCFDARGHGAVRYAALSMITWRFSCGDPARGTLRGLSTSSCWARDRRLDSWWVRRKGWWMTWWGALLDRRIREERWRYPRVWRDHEHHGYCGEVDQSTEMH